MREQILLDMVERNKRVGGRKNKSRRIPTTYATLDEEMGCIQEGFVKMETPKVEETTSKVLVKLRKNLQEKRSRKINRRRNTEKNIQIGCYAEDGSTYI